MILFAPNQTIKITFQAILSNLEGGELWTQVGSEKLRLMETPQGPSASGLRKREPSFRELEGCE